MTTSDDGGMPPIPDFLDRTKGPSKEQTDAEQGALNTKAAEGEIKSPAAAMASAPVNPIVEHQKEIDEQATVPAPAANNGATGDDLGEKAIMERNLFDVKTGAFRKNIRLDEGDLTELRQSMQTFGWIEEFPALVDEHDVVLVGHRRLQVASELKIEPKIKKLTLGSGDEADAQRLKLAIASNIGFAPMTKDDRMRIAEYLYGEREWTMARIAEALNVGIGTVSRDLGNSSTVEKSKHAKTTSNPKGAGRPKGSGRATPAKSATSKPTTPKPKNPVIEPAPEERVIPEVVATEEELVLLREFARFFVTERALVKGLAPQDRREFKLLFTRVKAILGGQQ
jgi:hypothetical protein